MLISEEFFNRLSQSYQKLIRELDDNLAKIDTATMDFDYFVRDIKREILSGKAVEKFFADYLMPKEYWEHYLRLNVSYRFNNEPANDEIIWKAYQHFYCKTYNSVYNPETKVHYYPKLLKYCDRGFNEQFIGEKDILYPQSGLKKRFQNWEKNSSSFTSTAFILQYDKMKNLYRKIKASESNVEEWFKNLFEVGDDEFFIHNVEYRLGGNLLDIKLWKLYITFLETFDPKKMLEVYSKYCRFFLDDSEMKEEYKAKVQEYGPSYVHWNIVFDFEERIKNFEWDSDKFPENFFNINELFIFSKPPAVDKRLSHNFYQTYHCQNFSLRKPMTEYILENANSTVWRKLHRTCKYFFAKKPVPICHRLKTKTRFFQDDTSIFREESLNLMLEDNEYNYLKNTWIATSIICISEKISHNYVSTIIPRLYQCNAKYIEISNQKLSFDELKFLIKSGNAIKLSLPCVRIKDDNDEWVYLEEIIKFLPNIEQLRLGNVRVNQNTASILAKQKFNSKINELTLLHIFGKPFDTMEFFDFCEQNRDNRFSLRMEFKRRRSGFTLAFVSEFQWLMRPLKKLKNTHVEISFTPL